MLINQLLFSNLILLVIVPLYYYTIELFRVFRGIFLLNHITVSNLLEEKAIKDNYLIAICYIFTLIILFLLVINYVGIFDKTVYSVLTENYLLQTFL